MAERFEAVYTDAQRDALATAYEDRRIRPARRVVDLAQAGELEPDLAPFTVHGGENTVRDMARKLRTRRAGEHSSALAKQPPRDAIETLRRRLVTVADETLAAVEKQKPEDRDPERVRQLARAIREAAAIPGPTDPTPARPGHTKDPDTGKVGEGATRGGLAGGVLAAAHRAAGGGAINATDQTAPDEQSGETDDGGKEGAADDHAAAHKQTTETEQPSPGEWARAELASVVVGSAGVRDGAAG